MACMFCGDSIDELVCYSCEDTAEMMNIDIAELAAIDAALKQAEAEQRADIEAPTDPAELVMCEACQ